jgi:hypothetical protein
MRVVRHPSGSRSKRNSTAPLVARNLGGGNAFTHESNRMPPKLRTLPESGCWRWPASARNRF